jgi:peroxiredoxin
LGDSQLNARLTYQFFRDKQMKKILIGFGVAVILLVGLGFIFKAQFIELAKDAITSDMFVASDTDDFNPGIKVGETFPAINATYNAAVVSDLEQFSGSNGTVFVVSRSLVWCPFCMKQMAQLNENLGSFEQAGINVVGLTYDSPEGQQPFKDKFSIAYPILSDNDAATVKILGILNEQYSPGEGAYGIGHPGAFVIDTNGVIVGKVFIEAYSSRVDAQSLLGFANSLLK